MIKSFVHKGLAEFHRTGSKKGIRPDHAPKLGRILDALETAKNPNEMDMPGYRLHELKGESKGIWAVTVNGNWRVTFAFDGEDVTIVDYKDYH
jgi:proteic killer suppression protein